MEGPPGVVVPGSAKIDEENIRHTRRVKLKELNAVPNDPGEMISFLETRRLLVSIFRVDAAKLDSSLKRHTALIKRMRQSIGAENRDQLLKDIDSLSLEKYIDEIASAAVEGVGRCKTEKDVWSAVEVRKHREQHV